MSESPSSLHVKIASVFLMAIIAIGGLGYISYSTLEELVDAITEEAKPNERLSLLRDILHDLSDAESSVRAYTITGEATLLTPYYESVTMIDEKMAKLRTSEEKRGEDKRMDSLDRLVEQKFQSLQSLIEIKNDANRPLVAPGETPGKQSGYFQALTVKYITKLPTKIPADYVLSPTIWLAFQPSPPRSAARSSWSSRRSAVLAMTLLSD